MIYIYTQASRFVHTHMYVHACVGVAILNIEKLVIIPPLVNNTVIRVLNNMRQNTEVLKIIMKKILIIKVKACILPTYYLFRSAYSVCKLS